MGLDGKKLEPESNVLLASIENMQYAVTLDVLHMVFLNHYHLFLTVYFASEDELVRFCSLHVCVGFLGIWPNPKDCNV